MQHAQQQISQPYFSKLRGFIWPVHRHELRKIVPMFTLFFLISFVYHILRCMKLTLTTAQGTGAAVGVTAIPFLKVWMVLPSALLCTFLYTKLANKYNRTEVFNKIIKLFISFFIAYLLFLYPNKELLALDHINALLITYLPSGFNGFIQLIHHWPSALFYVVAEMWSIIVLTMLFWGFTNEVTQVHEAKRFYALIALGANCAGIGAGLAQHAVTAVCKAFPGCLHYGDTTWDQTVALLLTMAIIASIAIIVIFQWLNTHVLDKQVIPCKPKEVAQQEAISLKNSFQYLLSSKHAAYLTLMVLSYNIIANLADMIWLDQVNQRITAPSDLNNYFATVDMMVGGMSVFVALFIFSNLIRRIGWTITAVIPPLIWLSATILLFSVLLLEHFDYTTILFGFFHLPVNESIIIFATLQMSLGKASKYTLFDQTKEIAFIPLSVGNQRKGKVMIDGITSRFGKSGSSIFLQCLLVACGGEIAKTLPLVAFMMLLMLMLWLYSTCKLGQELSKNSNNDIDKSTVKSSTF